MGRRQEGWQEATGVTKCRLRQQPKNLGSGQLWRSLLVFIWHAVVFARAQRHTISVTLIMPSWGALTKSGSHRVLMHSADSRSRTLLKAQQACHVSWN